MLYTAIDIMSLKRHQVQNENAHSSSSNKEIADYMTGDQTIRLTLNSMQLFSRFERSAIGVKSHIC